ncbi:mitochondrial carrier [Tilletiopsis washingtonensis]|uniref:Mitochondrial carrier n=1 Tax=Tilletiopsis washingtonensis TaxID=58919 RepID=A0A316ZHG2_9BASI|nr:mitochondrial carrier [Tilletiopsis washingtonensis]PWN99715.1 mitochondrial carrier [Tilletiopsis washingtonensis]
MAQGATSLGMGETFAVGSVAAMTAVLISNPSEVVKTRMQLQGELLSKGTGAPRLYKGALDCFTKTLRGEGVKGVQRGLGAALGYQVCLNGSRLGFYEPFRKMYNNALGRDPGEVYAPAALAAGASSGVVGAVLGNPLFLVKARLQAYSPQHQIGRSSFNYAGTWDGLRSIVRSDGWGGLARGVDAAMLRTAMGSSVQLPAYNWFKSYLVKLSPSNTWEYNPLLLISGQPNSFWTYLGASTFSGLCVCTVMQPADTALSRVYNQPTRIDSRGRSVGTLYRGPIHCLYLTAKTEGPLAWYKGTTAHLARIAPHTVLTLMANEAYLRYYSNFKAGRDIFAEPETITSR